MEGNTALYPKRPNPMAAKTDRNAMPATTQR